MTHDAIGRWYEEKEDAFEANDEQDVTLNADFIANHVIHSNTVIHFNAKGDEIFYVCLVYEDTKKICRKIIEGRENVWPVGVEKAGNAKVMFFKNDDEGNKMLVKIKEVDMHLRIYSIGCLNMKHVGYLVRRTVEEDTFRSCRRKCLLDGHERFAFQVNTVNWKRPACHCLKRKDGVAMDLTLFKRNKWCNCAYQNGNKTNGVCVYHTDIRADLTYPANEVAFFNGDTLYDHPKLNENHRHLTLVISHCDEDMAWMKDFLTYEIENVILYSKCGSSIKNAPPGSKIIKMPNYGRCDHSYAHWMANMKQKDATENHFVLFLKASRDSTYHTGMEYRDLEEMLQIAMINGFSCGYKSNSNYFYNTSRLKDFSLAKYKGQFINSSYVHMGDYLDAMGIVLPSPITPVCYGGNFIVNATQIYSKRIVLKRIEESLMRGDSIEEGHFIERVWAGLFQNPLNEDETDVLRRMPFYVAQTTVGYVGRLVSLVDSTLP